LQGSGTVVCSRRPIPARTRMISIASLWLPIVLSAVIVFIASALVWMALPHHKKEWKAFGNEEAVRAALRGASPGLYGVPFAGSREAMKDPAHAKKMEEGPVALVTVVPSGPHKMGGMMAPASGSGSCPAWIARVAKPCLRSSSEARAMP